MKIAKVLGVALAFPACFSFGFFWRDIKHGQLTSNRDRLLGIKTTNEASSDAIFKQQFGRILTDYTKRPDKTELKYSAMEGLVASLGDPHTNFFVPKVNTEFHDETQGKFYGIGARLLPDPLGVKVVSVFSDGPAKRVGVKGGDIVKLKVSRPGAKAPLDFVIPREKVVPPNVESKYIEPQKIGYIKILNFALEVPEQFDHELTEIETHDLKGLVIDLRDNPGGALDAAVAILSKWVEDKNIVKLKFRDGAEESNDALHGQLHNFKYPVVVLVNEDSASAAEIMAGALKDYGMAKLVGDHTYGKFSVQTVFSQRDGAGIKMTIAHYFLPKSGALSRKVDEDGAYISGGIQPDVKVELNPDIEFEAATVDKDAQFAKAVDIINRKG